MGNRQNLSVNSTEQEMIKDERRDGIHRKQIYP